jgi:Mg2+/citrate symporter
LQGWQRVAGRPSSFWVALALVICVIPWLQFVEVVVQLWWLGFSLAVMVVHPDVSASCTNIPLDDKVG